MVIVLDAGHGGYDPGAQGNGLKEKDITLKLVQKLVKRLGDAALIFMTRGADVHVSLADRVKTANESDAVLFLSVHVNAGGGTGFESYRFPGSVKGQEYQHKIHSRVAQYLAPLGVSFTMREALQPEPALMQSVESSGDYLYELPDRGEKAAQFYVLKYTKMPAVLLECLFIDNQTDAQYLKDEAFLDGLADAIAQGVLACFPEINPDELRKRIAELEEENLKLRKEYDEMRRTLRKVAMLTSKWVVE